jgi:hypothetical protein
VNAVGHDAEGDRHAAGRERDVEWALAIGGDVGRWQEIFALCVTPREGLAGRWSGQRLAQQRQGRAIHEAAAASVGGLPGGVFSAALGVAKTFVEPEGARVVGLNAKHGVHAAGADALFHVGDTAGDRPLRWFAEPGQRGGAMLWRTTRSARSRCRPGREVAWERTAAILSSRMVTALAPT